MFMMNISHNDPFRGLQQNISKIETIHNRKNRVHFFQNLQKKILERGAHRTFRKQILNHFKKQLKPKTVSGTRKIEDRAENRLFYIQQFELSRVTFSFLSRLFSPKMRKRQLLTHTHKMLMYRKQLKQKELGTFFIKSEIFINRRTKVRKKPQNELEIGNNRSPNEVFLAQKFYGIKFRL